MDGACAAAVVELRSAWEGDAGEEGEEGGDELVDHSCEWVFSVLFPALCLFIPFSPFPSSFLPSRPGAFFSISYPASNSSHNYPRITYPSSCQNVSSSCDLHTPPSSPISRNNPKKNLINHHSSRRSSAPPWPRMSSISHGSIHSF